jgi:hypothetical protein
MLNGFSRKKREEIAYFDKMLWVAGIVLIFIELAQQKDLHHCYRQG